MDKVESGVYKDVDEELQNNGHCKECGAKLHPPFNFCDECGAKNTKKSYGELEFDLLAREMDVGI